MVIIFASIVIFGIIIFVHELGHFLAAKAFGIRVMSACFGFGPCLWKKSFGETLYCIRAVPLGGYVRPFASVDTLPEELTKKKRNKALSFLAPMEPEEAALAATLPANDPGNLLHKGFLPRLAFIIAGSAFNLLFAYLCLCSYHLLRPITVISKEPVVGVLRETSPAFKAGLRQGDRVKAIDGVPVNDTATFAQKFREIKDSPAKFLIERKSGQSVSEIPITLRQREVRSSVWNKTYYSAGIRLGKVEVEKSLKMLLVVLRVSAESVLKGFVQVITFSRSEKKNPADSKSIAPINNFGFISSSFSVGADASKSWKDFYGMLLAMSTIIAALNLLPLPALDGGALFILVLQKICRLPITLEHEQVVLRFGMAVILLLMGVSFGDDIVTSIRLMLA